MAEAYFYHLTRSDLLFTLRRLIEKSRAAGWRVAVRGGDMAQLARLDEQLWLGPEEAFLAHGIAGGKDDDAQPVLLTPGAVTNGADCLMLIVGGAFDAGETADYKRCCIIFDGNDSAAVEIARDHWRAVTALGHAASYWSEEAGRWEKKAESGGAT